LRRPNRRANAPTGSVAIHMPRTNTLMGSVANPLSGASTVPTMPAVATSTVLLPPASAWVAASTSALRRARRSPASTSTTGSARADIRVLQKGISVEWILFLAVDPK
jgi:hypothetical protein